MDKKMMFSIGVSIHLMAHFKTLAIAEATSKVMWHFVMVVIMGKVNFNEHPDKGIAPVGPSLIAINFVLALQFLD
jgi:hypothetical protein